MLPLTVPPDMMPVVPAPLDVLDVVMGVSVPDDETNDRSTVSSLPRGPLHFAENVTAPRTNCA